MLAAGAPILVSLAALQGWTGPLIVLALFVVLELFTNLVLETVLYAGAVGVSQVVLLVSVAFWTWLWGPLGLLMASPLTVCLVVLGKHVPGLAFVGLLMDDTPALAPEYGYYQRLVARDQSEAAELIDSHIKTEPPASVYDALLLPALSYAERDRIEHRLSSEEEAAVIEATRELIVGRGRDHPPPCGDGATRRGRRCPRLWDRASRCAYWATRSTGPPMKWRSAMLAHLLDDLPIAMEITGTRMQAVELVSLVRDRQFSVVCFADLPPSSSSKTRYLVKRLRAALPEVRIAVGRWAPPALADESTQTLHGRGRQSRRLSVDRELGITSAASWRCRAFRSRTPRRPSVSRHRPQSVAGRPEPECAVVSSTGVDIARMTSETGRDQTHASHRDHLTNPDLFGRRPAHAGGLPPTVPARLGVARFA